MSAKTFRYSDIFFEKTRIFGVEIAFEEYVAKPNKTYESIAKLPLTLYVCLRLPTYDRKARPTAR
jgi:hypothetical protein